jgi:hypothetical protein
MSKSLQVRSSFAIIFYAALCLGCGKEKNSSIKGLSPERASQLSAMQEKRENRQKQLHSMSATQLVGELASDSAKGRESFNSSAYRETVSRGEAVAGELKQSLTRRDQSSLLALLALRQVSPGTYNSLEDSLRVAVLTSSLENSQYFNAWGIPNFYWEDAAKALIEEGASAEPALLKLLGDKRPAPVFGSEGATVDAQFHYRVCDYAWALLNEITRQKVEAPADPAERDRLIEKMSKESPKPKQK